MRRREFIKVVVGSAAIAWPLAARAQSDRVRRIGLLTPLAESDPEGQARLRALRQELERLGWIEGRNFEVDYQRANEDADHLRAAAAKLVGHAPDVVVVNSTVMLTALKRATQSLPIVFVQVPDPVRGGFVASGASRRQYHRIYEFRVRTGRKVAGPAQRNRAGARASGGDPKSG